MDLTAGNAVGYRSCVINTGVKDILVLPAVTVVTFLSGSARPDGFTHVLGLRIVVPEGCGVPVASCCGSGSSPCLNVAASFGPHLSRGPRPAQHLSGSRGAQHDACADPRDARQK